VTKHGAVAVHLLTTVHGGSATGTLISVAEYPDHRTWGEASEAITQSAEGQALTAEMLGSANAPFDIAFSALYTEIPL
jgi:hypothetical protein